MKTHPWTKREIILNCIYIIGLMSLASYMLLVKSWILAVIYWIFWTLYIIVGRSVSCRHCEFYGKPCPTWCMGIIGGLLYERSDKKSFLEVEMWKLYLLDGAFVILAISFPLVVFVYISIVLSISVMDWILLGAYLTMTVITLKQHDKGCRKCPIAQCPLKKIGKIWGR